MSARARLEHIWYGNAAAGVMLRFLSWIYRGAMALRRVLYRRGILKTYRVGRPVLVVGNLTVGGTGKTPLVIWLARRFLALGLKPGIVSRGYGRIGTAPRRVGLDTDWREVGDEPWLIHRATRCPTVVAQDRVVGARMLVEQGVDLILADDGLQHLRLARDGEIVVVDGARGFGNGRTLPAGPLRENLARLTSVDALVVNGVGGLERLPEQAPKLRIEMTLAPGKALPACASAYSNPNPDAPLPARVHGVAGIGNPARFFRDLRARGFEVIEHPFPDHHTYVPQDLQFDDELPVLMTEKDAVKCRELEDARLWYVPVEARIPESQARELVEYFLRKLGVRTPANRQDQA